jgi:hypothetical protein
MNGPDKHDTSRVGTNDQEIKVLSELDELHDFENENWSRTG